MDDPLKLFKLIISALVGLILLCSAAQANECISVDSIVTEFAKEDIHLRGSTRAATEKLAEAFNHNLEARGHPKIEISIFLFGSVKNAAGDIVAIVAVADQNGCIVPGSVAILTAEQWIKFANQAGVTSKDFIPFDGA